MIFILINSIELLLPCLIATDENNLLGGSKGGYVFISRLDTIPACDGHHSSQPSSHLSIARTRVHICVAQQQSAGVYTVDFHCNTCKMYHSFRGSSWLLTGSVLHVIMLFVLNVYHKRRHGFEVGAQSPTQSAGNFFIECFTSPILRCASATAGA